MPSSPFASSTPGYHWRKASGTGEHSDVIDAGGGTDTLVLVGNVGGTDEVIVNLSSSTDQVVSIGGVADLLVQKNFEKIDATGLGSSINATGNSGANVLAGGADATLFRVTDGELTFTAAGSTTATVAANPLTGRNPTIKSLEPHSYVG